MVELLAPAGDLEKLKFSVLYGANSVYLAGKSFGMRANAGNFTTEEMLEAVSFAHEHDVKVFVTVNIAAFDSDFSELETYLINLKQIGVDGIIAADPGVVLTIKRLLPDMPISISTQANTTNLRSVEFWASMGVKRVILARELSFEQIKYICQNRPKGIEIEVFVHGAMCVSYSGRCLLSNYLAGRDASRGDCAQPCRWKYTISEINRENEELEIIQDSSESYIMNSKDLCLIRRIPELIEAGVDSFKIEGRMKSIYYTACVTNAYRVAIDRYNKNKQAYSCDDLIDELCKVSHRDYTEAFYSGSNNKTLSYDSGGYIRNYQYIAQVLDDSDQENIAHIYQKNKFTKGDSVEFISPGGAVGVAGVEMIYDAQMNERQDAPHPNEELYLKLDKRVIKNTLIRKKI